VAIPCVIEWKEHRTGWRASATLSGGRQVNITEAHSLSAVRRRLRKALVEAGVDPSEELTVDLRIPKHLAEAMEDFQKLRARIQQLEAQYNDTKPQLAQRLLTELNLTEREAAIWIGVSHTHLSALLQSHTSDTGEPGDTGEVSLDGIRDKATAQ